MKNIELKEHKIAGNKYKIVTATGKQNKSGCHIYLFAIYIPPKMRVATFADLIECLVNEISLIKSKHGDTPPTCGDAHLDLIATNIKENLLEKGIFPPPL